MNRQEFKQIVFNAFLRLLKEEGIYATAAHNSNSSLIWSHKLYLDPYQSVSWGKASLLSYCVNSLAYEALRTKWYHIFDEMISKFSPTLDMEYDLKMVKIKNEGDSSAIQRKLFEFGCCWASGDRNVLHFMTPGLFISSKKAITYTEDGGAYFNGHHYMEIDADLILNA